jgi:predicted RNase H-like nuclease (RuvC/YqgF family)
MGEVTTFHCYDCGILMGIDADVVTSWKKSHKNFSCPNGHIQHWPDQTDQEKELVALRAQVKDLKTHLDEALTLTETQKKRIEELTAELEIWRPTTSETDNGSEQAGVGDRAG